eukprot:3606068-Pleurochrysis_carterae.AAC.1
MGVSLQVTDQCVALAQREAFSQVPHTASSTLQCWQRSLDVLPWLSCFRRLGSGLLLPFCLALALAVCLTARMA